MGHPWKCLEDYAFVSGGAYQDLSFPKNSKMKLLSGLKLC